MLRFTLSYFNQVISYLKLMYQNVTINSNPINRTDLPQQNSANKMQQHVTNNANQHHQMGFFLDQRISNPIGIVINSKNVNSKPQRPQNTHQFHHEKHSSSLNREHTHHQKVQTHSFKNIPDKMYQIKRIQHFSYATSDQIGIGFSSRVYKGKNDKTNELVAIKVIDLKGIEDQLHQQFLNQEVAVLQKVKNAKPQNLLKLEGVFKTKNNLYIVSQFCEGKDMGKILRKKKQLTQEQAQSVMKQLLSGYAEMHKLGIVHRDFKLANIFVKKGCIKIADFGFAIDSNKCNQKFTYNVGSPYYMPPESLKNNQYSYKSDIWSIGIIAYELVHGKAPWKDKNDAVLFQKMTSTPIQSIIDPQLKLSQNYVNFIRRCVTCDIERRANPNLITSWPWNLAKDVVQGIQQKMTSGKHILHHAHSLGEDFVLQPGNQDFFKKKHTVVTSHVNMEQHKLNNVKALINADKKASQSSKSEGSPFWVEQTVLAQLHYCRFLSNLFEQIHKDRTGNQITPMINPPGLIKHRSQFSGVNSPHQIPNLGQILELLKKSIAQRIIGKIELLLQIARTDQNMLKIPGFSQYAQTQGWQKLKSVIKQYQAKYYDQYKNIVNFSKTSSIPNQQLEQILVETISKVKGTLNNHTKNLRLLQLLTFYYQILGLQKQNNPSSFAKVAKMDLINSKKQYESLAIQRLMKKLEYMGL